MSYGLSSLSIYYSFFIQPYIFGNKANGVYGGKRISNVGTNGDLIAHLLFFFYLVIRIGSPDEKGLFFVHVHTGSS